MRSRPAVGRLPVSWIGWTGNSSGMPPASRMPSLHALGQHQVVPVAGRQIAAGLGDADDRPAPMQFLQGEPEIGVSLEVERGHVGMGRIVEPAAGTQSDLQRLIASARVLRTAFHF